jgi:protein-glucosylgalactosylhydroxylysine glucosidase
MTWAMHTIGYLDLHDTDEAAKNFEKSYSVYVRKPFFVWSETMPGQPAAGNFITGAGGFLQSIINGYGGVRLHFNYMSISNFYVPPKSQSLNFKGLTYLNNRFSLTITSQGATITFVEIDVNHKLKITKNPSKEEYGPQKGTSITLKNDEELILEADQYPFGECKMKEVSASTKVQLSIISVSIFTFLINFL